MKCPICNSTNTTAYFEVKNSPLLQNVLYKSRAAAINVEVVDANFFRCISCSALFNPWFKVAPYDKTYNNDQNHSEVYRTHLKSVADIIESYLHHGSRLLEIGCGNGAILNTLFERGYEDIVGYDPAHSERLPFIKRSYWDTKDTKSYDIIVLRHTLEGIPNVRKFFKEVAKRVNDDGVIYLELTSANFILENASTQILYNECAQYFSEESIGYLLSHCGYYVQRMHRAMGGEIFGVVGKKKTDRKPIAPSLNKLNSYKKICIWGISGRSIHFLTNYAIGKDLIQFGVDMDPRKQNKYIPVSGQKILSPEKCRQLRPDAIIVLNDNYVPEVASQFDYPVEIFTRRDLYEF